MICVGVLWGLSAFTAGPAPAQTPKPATAPKDVYLPRVQGNRLTVRPRDMATGARTERAGQFLLDATKFKDYWAYVPQQCVGTRRCPLVVYLHGAGAEGRLEVDSFHLAADKYGMIVLAPTARSGLWSYADQKYIDAAMQQVLRTFAIDPDRIALAGISAGGAGVGVWGGYNPDVFNRQVFVSGTNDAHVVDSIPDATAPGRPRVEYYVVTSLSLLQGEVNAGLQAVQGLRRKGYHVKSVVGIRGHGEQSDANERIAAWLQESWATPNPANRRPLPVASATTLLTSDALTRLANFWKRFLAEPDSIRVTERRKHLRELVVPIGGERAVVAMVDMAALAAHCPSVAADLKAAGLTSQQHDAYRTALVTALATLLATPGYSVRLDSAIDKAGVKKDQGLNIALGAIQDEDSRYPQSVIGQLRANAVVARNIEFMYQHLLEWAGAPLEQAVDEYP